jgi:hypothetical protein
MRSTVEAGGADPDNARRSVPGPCDLRPAIGAPGARLMAGTSSRDAAPRTLRRGPAVAGAGAAVRGSRCARRAAARKGASEAAAPQRRVPPRLWAPPSEHPAALLTPRLLAPAREAWPRPSGLARRRCALDDREENPHSHATVTAGSPMRSDRTLSRWATVVYRGV